MPIDPDQPDERADILDHEDAPAVQEYAAPALVELGSFEELTQGGAFPVCAH